MMKPSYTFLVIALTSLLAAGACDDNKKNAAGDSGVDIGPSQGQPAPSPEPVDQGAENGGESGPDVSVAEQDAGLERPQASSDKSGTITEKPPLSIESYLTVKDIREVAGGGDFKAGQLVGEKPTPTYNARRIKPAQGDDFGAGLQVWSFDDQEAAVSKLESLRPQFLNVSDPPKKAEVFLDRSFVAKRSGLQNFVFHISNPPRVVAITCSTKTCDSVDKLLSLARQTDRRIKK